MDIQTKHFLNGTQISPFNADSIGFKIDYTADYNKPELNVDSIILKAPKDRQLILDHIATLGVYEGMPYDIVVGSLTLNYYIDFTENVVIGDSQIEVNIKRRFSVKAFKDRANGSSFEYLNTLNPFEIKRNQYMIVSDTVALQMIIMLMNTFALLREVILSAKSLGILGVDTVEANTPDVPLAVAGAPPTPVVGVVVKPATTVSAIIKIILQIAFTLAVIIQMVIMLKRMFELFVPPVRYFNVTRVKHLLERGCDSLGYGFQSSILDQFEGLTVQPVPLNNPESSVWKFITGNDNTVYTKGYPTASDTTPTLGKLIDFVVEWCNGELRVDNTNTVRIEHDFNDVPSASVVNTLNVQSKRENQHTFNFGETWKRYYLHYLTDNTDMHTLDNFQNGQIEKSTEPVNVVNADLVSIRGLAEPTFPFAFGARKTELNVVEKALFTFAKLADGVVNTLGGQSSLATLVTNRIGSMMISQQQFTTTKLLYMSGERQTANFMDVIGSKQVYDRWHFTNEVKENFKSLFNSTIPLSPEQFDLIVNGNKFITDQITGEELEILIFEWINDIRQGTIDYAVKSDEGNNTKTIQFMKHNNEFDNAEFQKSVKMMVKQADNLMNMALSPENEKLLTPQMKAQLKEAEKTLSQVRTQQSPTDLADIVKKFNFNTPK